MQVAQYSLTVLCAGSPAREYGHDGRVYVAGRTGSDYTIRLSNRTGCRTKAVVAVDGLSVIDGKPASKEGTGYILEPWSTVDIPGWRVSDAQVARFVFGEAASSYASQIGKPDNLGIIAAAFYQEVPPPPSVASLECFGPAVAKGGFEKTSGGLLRSGGGSLGTGFGHKVSHAVRRVDFQARPTPAAVIEIRYEDAAILRGFGIAIDDDAAAIHSPSGFPADDAGYCQPPRGWRG